MGRGGHVTNGERRTAAAEVAGAGSREAGAVVMQYEGDSRSAVPGSRNPIAVHLDYGVMYAACVCVCVCVCVRVRVWMCAAKSCINPLRCILPKKR